MSAFDVRDLLDAAERTGQATALPLAGSPAHTPPALLSPVVLAGCVRVAEFLLIALTGVGIHQAELAGIVPLAPQYLVATLGAAALAVFLIQAGGAYRITALRTLRSSMLRLAGAWALAFLIVATVMVFAKIADHYSRIWLASFFAGGLAALMVERSAVAWLIATQMQRGHFDRRTAIVGGGVVAEELIRALDAQTDSGVRIVGVFDDRGDTRSDTVVAGYPKLGTVNDLVAYARNTRIDLIIVTIPISAEDRILQMLAKLWVLPIDIRLSAQASKLRLRPRAYSYLGSVPVLDVFDKPMADWDIVTKSVFDRVVGLAMLLALSPVMLGVALAVRLTSPGPVLFRQKRYGFNNELIEVFKFRSMYVNQSDAGAAKLVTRDDPASRPWAGSSARPRSTNCRSSSTSSRANSPWSAPGPTPSRPRPPTPSTIRSWTATSPATGSNPASPAGPRSMAGAAKPIPATRSRSASTTTCITSRTGRSSSTSGSCSRPPSRCSGPRTPTDRLRRPA